MRISPFWYSLLGISFIFTSLSVFAQPTAKFTIEELQRLGLQANGLVQAARSQIEMAKAGVVAASAFLNPEVTVTAGPDSNRYSLAVTGPTSMQRSVTVSQPIENPFMRSARINASEAAVDASRASYDQVRADLAAQLRIRAFELLLRQEQAEMEQGIYELVEDVRRRIAINVERGEVARFELIRAETEVQSALNRAQAAQLTVQRARLALMQLTAGAMPVNFEINASLKDPVQLPPLEVLRQEVSAVNPDVLRLQAEQERANERIKQEKAAVLPQINVLYTNYQDAQFTSNIAGANVRIPIFYRRRGEIDTAIYDSARIRETLEFRRYEISQLFESAWQALQIAQRRVDMFEGGLIKEAENAVQVAQAAYRFGERSLFEFLDTQRILRGILGDSLQARFDLQAAVAEIDRLRAHYPKELVVE
ncbi:MAG: TolC family protein [Proteobacteria bacterium]|nr:TolC family protein [Pseudomonadota bacterium]